MATWSTDFSGDTVDARPAATVSGSYGTQTWYSGPAGTTADAKVRSGGPGGDSKSLVIPSPYGATGATYYATSSIAATTYFRAYIYLTAGFANDVILFRVATGGYARQNAIGLKGRQLYSKAYATDFRYDYGTESSKTISATNAIPLNEWVRIEGMISATSAHAKMWRTTGGSGYNATGSADVDLGAITGTSIGTFAQIQNGFESGAAFASSDIYLGGLALSDSAWIGPNTVTHSGSAAASETASATAFATATRVLAGMPSITAGATANAGLLLTALGTPSITASGSADASVITTHNAEAASIITVGTTNGLGLTQGMVAASTITATATAVGATNTAANGAVQAIAEARAVVEGETSPGFLYATVAKNILTN